METLTRVIFVVFALLGAGMLLYFVGSSLPDLGQDRIVVEGDRPPDLAPPNESCDNETWVCVETPTGEQSFKRCDVTDAALINCHQPCPCDEPCDNATKVCLAGNVETFRCMVDDPADIACHKECPCATVEPELMEAASLVMYEIVYAKLHVVGDSDGSDGYPSIGAFAAPPGYHTIFSLDHHGTSSFGLDALSGATVKFYEFLRYAATPSDPTWCMQHGLCERDCCDFWQGCLPTEGERQDCHMVGLPTPDNPAGEVECGEPYHFFDAPACIAYVIKTGATLTSSMGYAGEGEFYIGTNAASADRYSKLLFSGSGEEYSLIAELFGFVTSNTVGGLQPSIPEPQVGDRSGDGLMVVGSGSPDIEGFYSDIITSSGKRVGVLSRVVAGSHGYSSTEVIGLADITDLEHPAYLGPIESYPVFKKILNIDGFEHSYDKIAVLQEGSEQVVYSFADPSNVQELSRFEPSPGFPLSEGFIPRRMGDAVYYITEGSLYRHVLGADDWELLFSPAGDYFGTIDEYLFTVEQVGSVFQRMLRIRVYVLDTGEELMDQQTPSIPIDTNFRFGDGFGAHSLNSAFALDKKDDEYYLYVVASEAQLMGTGTYVVGFEISPCSGDGCSSAS